MGARAAYSFFAAFVGWLVGFVALLMWIQSRGSITDFEFLLLWPLVVTFAGWLLVGLPIALLLSDERARRPGAVLVLAVAAAMGAFGAVNLLFGFGLTWMSFWPLVIGVVGGGAFVALVRWRPRHTWVLWVAPMLLFASVRYVAVPLSVAYLPCAAASWGDGVLGVEAQVRVYRSATVGDSWDDLHARCPHVFDEPFLARGVGGRSGQERVDLEFDRPGGVVVSVGTAP